MNDTTLSKERLAASFRAVMDDIDALMASTGEQASGETEALRARIRERLEDAKDRLSDARHEAVRRAKAAAASTDDYVHDNPWQAIGLAAAVGLAVGVLIGRR